MPPISYSIILSAASGSQIIGFIPFSALDGLNAGLREQGRTERVHRHAEPDHRYALELRRGHAGIRANEKLHAVAD